MSDSGEPETSVQESQLAEQESKSQKCEMTKSLKRRTLEEDEDEHSRNETSRLEKAKKVAKQTSRKLETDFEPTVFPLDCSICKQPFLDPVVTNCYHYFCKKCALKVVLYVLYSNFSSFVTGLLISENRVFLLLFVS